MKTAALVIHRIRYSDSASIIKCYTPSSGLIGCFHRHNKKRNGILDHQFYELTLDRKPGGELYNIKDSNYVHELNSTVSPFNMPLWLLLNEIIMKTTAEHVTIPGLFDLLAKFRSLLSEAQDEQELLAVILIGLSQKLGVLSSEHVPPLNTAQRQHLELLKQPIPDTKGFGSSPAMMEHIKAHYDIREIFSWGLLH